MKPFAVVATIALFPAICGAAAITLDLDVKACKELEGEKAIAACSRVLQSKPLSKEREIETRHTLGIDQIKSAHFDDAIANITRAALLDPKISGAYSLRGIAYANKNEFDKALADFSTAIKLDQSNFSAYSGRCQIYTRQAKYDLALADCDKLVSLKPTVSLAWSKRAFVHLIMHNYDSAISDLDRAIQLDLKSPQLYSLRALAYSGKSDYGHAVADDLTAAEMSPDDWNTLRALFGHLIFARRNDRVAVFDELMRKHPEAAAPYYFRGEAREEDKKLKEAIADLDTYIHLRPENAKGYGARGTYFEEEGEYSKATDDLSEAIKREKESNALSALYEHRCQSRAEAGEDLDAGIVDCTQTLRMNDGRWGAYVGRGFAQFRQRKYEAALADFDKRIDVQIKPTDMAERAEDAFVNLMTGRPIGDPPYYPRGSILSTELATAFCGRALERDGIRFDVS